MNLKSRLGCVGLFLLMMLVSSSISYAEPKNALSIEERVFPQHWRISLNVIGRRKLGHDERRRRAKLIEPQSGEATITLKNGGISGDVIWTGRRGAKSAGKVTGWLKGNRYTLVLSYPSDFLRVQGYYKFEKFESESAMLRGKAYSSFHMTPIDKRSDNFPGSWTLRFNNSLGSPETMAKVQLHKEGERLVGRTVRGQATRTRYSNDTSPLNGNIVGLFEGSIKGDQFVGSCTEDAGKTILNGKWDPFTLGFTGICTRNGGASGTFQLSSGGFVPEHLGKAEERTLRLVLSPPLKGARIDISPLLNLKFWKNQARATMSYRIGWCGNEVPRKFEYKGSCANGVIKLAATNESGSALIQSLDLRLGSGVAFTGVAVCSDGATRSVSPYVAQKH